MNYAELRLDRIGFNPDLHWAYFSSHPDEPHAPKVKKPIFWPDDKGNLCIGIYDLNREFYTIDLKDSRSKLDNRIFHYIRYSEPKIIDGKERKITPCTAGQGSFPYIPLSVVEKYKLQQKIKTLVLTEGQIKTFVASNFGVDIVGLPGIQVWNTASLQGIFHSIDQIIKTCNVETLIWLTDADTFKMEWSEGKDLGKRLHDFCNSVIQFKERTRDFNCRQIYAHINSGSLSKGIDDLLLDKPECSALIIDELLKADSKTEYFSKLEISNKSITKIKEYFGLEDGVKSFYNKFENVIGLREFGFLKGSYRYDEVSQKVVYVKCGESSQFIMVDSTYYIKGPVPTKYGEIENTLKPIKPAGIKAMFKNKSTNFLDEANLSLFMKKLLYDIPYYNGFINRPDHINYRKEFPATDKHGHDMKYYNKYFELSHNPEQGECPLSLDFVKHIFGTGEIHFDGKKYKEYDLGLDYIQLLYLEPTQFLPILCLVSKQRGTGKTKFWEWIGAIFQQNVKPINSQMLNGQFTSLFASSLLVYIDEAFLDKKETIEKLKSLVTSDKGKIKHKGVDADIIDNFLKVGISTNDETSFAYIPGDEVRFWVRKIHPIPQDRLYKHWFDHLRKEIPAFLNFLRNRKLVTEYRHRGWFHPEIIKTEALQAIVNESRSSIEIAIEEALREHMSIVKKPVIHLSTKDIRDLIDDNKIQLTQIRWALTSRLELVNQGISKEYEKYYLTTNSVGDPEVRSEMKKSTFYTITASSIFSVAQILELFSTEEILEMEEIELKLYDKSLFWSKFNHLNKGLLFQIEEFKSRTENSLEILISESSSFSFALEVCTHVIKEQIK